MPASITSLPARPPWTAWPRSIPWSSAAILTAGAVLYVACGLRTLPAFYYATLGSLLLLAAWTDARYRLIPNGLVLVAAVCASTLVISGTFITISEGLQAGSLVVAVMMAARWAGHLTTGTPGMGMGDVKLAGVLGLLLGFDVVPVLYLAFVLAGVWAAAGIAWGKLDRRTHLPFAPFMALGAFLELFFHASDLLWHCLGL